MKLREKYQYHLKRLVEWAEMEMDTNTLLSLKTKEKIKKIGR